MFLLCAPPAAHASQHFTDDTGKKCEYCHIGPPDTLVFTPEGERFVNNYYQLSQKAAPDPSSIKSAFLRKIRRLLLSVHAVAATAFLGAVMFIGIAATPRVEEAEAPKAMWKFLWISLAAAGICGAALFPFTIAQNEKLWGSSLGAYLTIKVSLYAALVLLIAVAARTAHKVGLIRKRVEEELCAKSASGGFVKFSPADLRMFNGRQGRRCLIAFKGKVYDATGNRHWEYGIHFSRHSAGRDLTEEIKGAPHSAKVIDSLPVAGEYDPSARESGSASMREFKRLAGRFYGIVKFNVGLAASIALLSAIWRDF
jgi:predicted heme/steroid binding protein